jgi:hypothetical protein
MLLIQICLVVAVVYVVLWVLSSLGIELPAMIVKIFWIIVALIILLLLYRMIAPSLRSGHLFGLFDVGRSFLA